jgi:hypothetical protein
MESKGTPKIKMGEILGVPKEKTNYAKTYRMRSFFGNLKRERIEKDSLEKVAAFFEKPIEFFLMESTDLLCDSRKSHAKPPASFDQISEALREMGYSEDFIQGHITALKSISQ